MASYPLPQWLQTYGDPGELYLQSQRMNAAVQEAQQRLDQAAQQAQVENQIKREAIQQRALESDQRLAVEQARMDIYSGMRARALDIAQQKADAVAQRTAAQFAAQQDFTRRVNEEGPENAAKIALTTPGLGLPGSGIAALSRSVATAPELNMGPQWVVDPETQKLIGYNRRTGTPHYRPVGAHIPEGAVTQRERAQIQFLQRQLPPLDKELNDAIMHRAEMRSDADIQSLDKDMRPGALKMRERAQQLRAERERITKQIEDIINPTAPAAAAPTAAAAPAPASIPERKAARANALASQHPDWSRDKILEQVAKDFP